MLKNKYQRMSPAEKKEIKEKFFKTVEGNTIKYRLFNSRLYSCLLFAWAIINIIIMIVTKDYSFINITFIILSVLFAILFIVIAAKIESEKLNSFAIDEEKKNKKTTLEDEIEKEYKSKNKKKK